MTEPKNNLPPGRAKEIIEKGDADSDFYVDKMKFLLEAGWGKIMDERGAFLNLMYQKDTEPLRILPFNEAYIFQVGLGTIAEME